LLCFCEGNRVVPLSCGAFLVECVVLRCAGLGWAVLCSVLRCAVMCCALLGGGGSAGGHGCGACRHLAAVKPPHSRKLPACK
jgi:hypothetical protein